MSTTIGRLITALTKFKKSYSKKDKAFFMHLKKITGLTPINLALYREALTTPSYKSIFPNKETHISDYERLEYVGDAVLDAIIADFLFRKFPDAKPGILTAKRTELVNGNFLGLFAEKLLHSDFIFHNFKTHPISTKVYGDLMESLIGAIYMDLGYEAAKTFIHNKFIGTLTFDNHNTKFPKYKSKFMVWIQRNRKTYHVEFEEIKAKHLFRCTLTMEKHHVTTIDTSKKKAEELAMQKMCNRLNIKLSDD